MQTSWADLFSVGGQEAKPDLRGVTRHQHTARLLKQVPLEQPSPKGRDLDSVSDLERHRLKLQHHACTVDPGLLGQPPGFGTSSVCDRAPGQRLRYSRSAHAIYGSTGWPQRTLSAV